MGRNGSQSSGSYAVVENCGCFMLQRIAVKRKKNLLLLTAMTPLHQIIGVLGVI